MGLYTYQNWQILVSSCKRGWTFHVLNVEREMLSDCCLYKSLEAALCHAQLYIDFQIDRQVIRQRIMTNLDTLLEQKGIDIGRYIQAVRFLRDN